jgi:hypothetical protein
MSKYKLVKTYPGSPDLGTVAEKESKIKSNTSYYYREGEKRYCIYDYHVEDNPEYWEKVNENLWYVVIEDFFNFGNGFHRPWTIHNVEALNPEDIQEQLWGSVKKNIFKTKQEAEEFMLYNKPCLSYKDVMNHKTYLSNQLNEYTLKEFIKSKL